MILSCPKNCIQILINPIHNKIKKVIQLRKRQQKQIIIQNIFPCVAIHDPRLISYLLHTISDIMNLLKTISYLDGSTTKTVFFLSKIPYSFWSYKFHGLKKNQFYHQNNLKSQQIEQKWKWLLLLGLLPNIWPKSFSIWFWNENINLWFSIKFLFMWSFALP